MDLNKVMLIGRLTRDPERKELPSGTALTEFTVATSRKWKDKQTGEAKEMTEFSNCVAWGNQADTIAQYTRKGGQVYVEGSLETQSWQDKETGDKKYKTVIKVYQCIFLGKQGETQEVAGNQMQPTQQAPQQAAEDEDILSSVPF